MLLKCRPLIFCFLFFQVLPRPSPPSSERLLRLWKRKTTAISTPDLLLLLLISLEHSNSYIGSAYAFLPQEMGTHYYYCHFRVSFHPQNFDYCRSFSATSAKTTNRGRDIVESPNQFLKSVRNWCRSGSFFSTEEEDAGWQTDIISFCLCL